MSRQSMWERPDAINQNRKTCSDRSELVGLLIDSLDESIEPSAEGAWLEEINRRAQELDSGAVRSIPWELVREQFVRAPRG